MKLIFKKNSLYNLLYNISIGLLLFLFFYKLHFQSFIPISGDELNSILVYSSNIKTVLENIPINTYKNIFKGSYKREVKYKPKKQSRLRKPKKYKL